MAAQKVALITAGTAGLGAQIARVLAPDFRVVSTTIIKPEVSQTYCLSGHQLRKQPVSRQGDPGRTPQHPEHDIIF